MSVFKIAGVAILLILMVALSMVVKYVYDLTHYGGHNKSTYIIKPTFEQELDEDYYECIENSYDENEYIA